MLFQRKTVIAFSVIILSISTLILSLSGEENGDIQIVSFSSEFPAISPNKDGIQDNTVLKIQYEVAEKLVQTNQQDKKSHSLAILGFLHVINKDKSAVASFNYYKTQQKEQSVEWNLDWSAAKIPDGKYSYTAGGVVGTLKSDGTDLVAAAKPILDRLVALPRFCQPDLGRRHEGHLRLKKGQPRGKSPAMLTVDIKINDGSETENKDFKNLISKELAQAKKILQSVSGEGEWVLSLKGCKPLTGYSALTIDRVAPVVRIKGSPAHKGVFKDVKLPLKGNVSDAFSGLVKVWFDVDGASHNSTLGPNVLFVPAQQWTQGKHTWSLKATDKAGNTTIIPNQVFTSDYSKGAERRVTSSAGGEMQLPVKASKGYAAQKVSLKIPSGAVKSDLVLTITPSDNAIPSGMLLPIEVPKGGDAYYRRLGNTFNFGPHGTTFQSEIDISMSYSKEELRNLGIKPKELGIVYFDEKRKVWVSLPSVVDEARGVITAKTNHFSMFSKAVKRVTGVGASIIPPVVNLTLGILEGAGVPKGITDLLRTSCAVPFATYTGSVAASCYANPNINDNAEVVRALELVSSILMNPESLNNISIKYCDRLTGYGEGMVPLPELILINNKYKGKSREKFAELLVHEFHHIQQIRDRGFRTFACDYSSEIVKGHGMGEGNAVERPAYDDEREAESRLQRCHWDTTQPPIHNGVRNGQCLLSCGGAGGTQGHLDACANNNMRPTVTDAYDVPFCCRPSCDPNTQPSHTWGPKGDQCYKSCSALGGSPATSRCDKLDMIDVGEPYNAAYCCKAKPVPPGYSTVKDVYASALGNPGDVGAKFRAVHDYAHKTGFSGGYPNFHQADYGKGLVYGTVLLLPGSGAGMRTPFASELGNPPDGPARFRAVNDYAVRNGFAAGFPNFHQADYGQGVVYGIILIPKSNNVVRLDVPAKELGNPSGFEVRFRAVHDYAVRNGYAGGFPNFHQADYNDGRGVVYGVILLRRLQVH
ncbi:MAG: hypothetical protein ABUK01_13020 [Leptospirales bacterium]